MRRSGGRSDRLCPEKESELDELNIMAIVAGIMLVTFWLGAALCFVVIEPVLRRRAYEAADAQHRARIRQLENQVAIQRIGGELREQARGAALPVVDAEVE